MRRPSAQSAVLLISALMLAGCTHNTAATVGRPTQRDRDLMAQGLNFEIDGDKAAKVVDYKTKEKPGTVIVETKERRLYLVQSDSTAIQYPVAVGAEAYGWTGTATVRGKREWPDWHPPAEMRRRWPSLPTFMAGGGENPLGARALYLFNGGRDTLYRIHGTNDPYGIGTAVSSGCIRMHNEQVIDLYARVSEGAKVIVR